MNKLIIALLFIVILAITGCSNENPNKNLDRSCETNTDCVCNCDCGCFNVNDKCELPCKGFGPWKECEIIKCVRGPGNPVCINNTCQAEYP